VRLGLARHQVEGGAVDAGEIVLRLDLDADRVRTGIVGEDESVGGAGGARCGQQQEGNQFEQ
jgi:hypothetical protein